MDLYIYLFIVYILIVVSNKTLKILNNKLQNKNKMDWFKYAFLSRKHLVSLSIGDFEDWCVYFLKRLGYSDVKIVPTWENDSFKDIVCVKDNKAIYVSYFLTQEVDENADDYGRTGRPELQRFIGTMEHGNVCNGIVITTGDFSKEALSYVDSLPKKYSIKLFDGINLTKTHRVIREMEVALLLEQENY